MSSDRTVSSKPQPEPTPAQQAETLRNALQALTDYVDESPDVYIDTELAKRVSVARAALRAAVSPPQERETIPHESPTSAKEQCANIEVHLRNIVTPQQLEDAGATITEGRPLHIRVMRLLSDFRDRAEKAEAELAQVRAAVSGEGTTCATCVYAKNYRDVTDEWRTICERTKLDVTDTPEGFGCNFHQPAAPQEDSHAD